MKKELFVFLRLIYLRVRVRKCMGMEEGQRERGDRNPSRVRAEHVERFSKCDVPGIF